AGGSGHHDPRRRGRSPPCGVLPDARRRRPHLRPPALGVDQQRARPRGRHRAGQHRAGPPGPGAAAARPGGRSRRIRRACPARGLPGPAGGRAGLLPRRAGLPQRGLRRGGQRRLRRDHRSVAPLLHPPAGAPAAAGRQRRRRARGRRREGRQGGHLPPRLRRSLVRHPGARHRGVAAPAARGSPHRVADVRRAVADHRRRGTSGGAGLRRRPGHVGRGGGRGDRPRPGHRRDRPARPSRIRHRSVGTRRPSHRGDGTAARRDAGRRPRTPPGLVV
ncbi:MAG: 1,2-phenylacetyl-CoA epoxidase, subunit C, partial [uncultured Nocardioides sp.]